MNRYREGYLARRPAPTSTKDEEMLDVMREKLNAVIGRNDRESGNEKSMSQAAIRKLLLDFMCSRRHARGHPLPQIRAASPTHTDSSGA